MAKTAVWKDDYYLDAHVLARRGATDTAIAKSFGISLPTLQKWMEQRSTLREAVRRGRLLAPGHKAPSLAEYVYDRLPSHLKEFWDELEAYEKESNGLAKAQLLLKDACKTTKIHLWMHALFHYSFNKSRADKAIGITSATRKEWIETAPEFGEIIEQLKEWKGDLFEEAFIDLVRMREPSAVLFAMRTFNRDRGYAEKITHEGRIQHEHELIPIDSMNYTLEQKKQILADIQKAKSLLQITHEKENGNGASKTPAHGRGA